MYVYIYIYLPADSKSYTAVMNLGRLSLNKLWGCLQQQDVQLLNAAVCIARIFITGALPVSTSNDPRVRKEHYKCCTSY